MASLKSKSVDIIERIIVDLLTTNHKYEGELKVTQVYTLREIIDRGSTLLIDMVSSGDFEKMTSDNVIDTLSTVFPLLKCMSLDDQDDFCGEFIPLMAELTLEMDKEN